MARLENKVAKASKQTTRVVGYHNSRHASLKLFTSDRYKEMQEWARSFGLEIETACTWLNVRHTNLEGSQAIGALLQEVVLKEFPKDLFRWEQDGTITGAECVTQCMTKEFIRNHYPEFKNLFDDYFVRFGLTPNTSCGMHVNIGLGNFGKDEAKQLDCVRKLVYFINKHFELSCGLVRRTQTTEWCGQMRYDNAKTLDPNNYWDDHHSSINLGHYFGGAYSGRIELRLVGGQSNYAMFRNTMETVFWLVDVVKRVSWKDLDDVVKVFAGCNKYVLSRLELCRNEGRLSREKYERIAELSDTETNYL